ncbi:hypothetical protein LCGC14_2947090 [marine sediment metagenome]|uniref:Insertion element IS402-like domain-containing protein n=1 Tax=marine sediment metagenome TaxID=412755 RepID=A0A0F9A7I9_9ZZZZ
MSQKPFTHLSETQWELINHCLQKFSFPKERGTPRADMRKVWNAILYVLIRGCRWKELPKGEHWISKSTAHLWVKKFRTWGVFDTVFLTLLKQADLRKMIDWQQLNIDGSFSLRRRRG